MKETDFPILKQKIHGKRLIYLDNAATSQKPLIVINAIKKYYETINANTHRGTHTLANKATEAFETTRKKVANYLNAETEEIIFTKGTTEGINILAHGLKNNLKNGDEIVISIMEHHSNLVPWQIAAKETGAILKFIPITGDFRLDMDAAKRLITKKTKIVSITHMSNVLGTINPLKELEMLAHQANALFIVDAAQSIPHEKIDVKKINCDFLAFSAHKMCGPTGVGILFGKNKLLEKLEPFNYGGHMIEEVTQEMSTWSEIPHKFEGGTQNISDVIAFGTTIDYLESLEIEKARKQSDSVMKYALEEIKKIKQVKIIGPKNIENRGPVLSFHIEGIHPHDVVEILDRDGIALRGGHHCAMPLMASLKIPGTSRASFYFYNTKEDVDALMVSLKKAIKVFRL